MKNQTYPKIRQANEQDYSAIYEIWMQDHVIQYMSFTKMSLQDFQPIYQRLAKKSDIYVMVDLIDGKEKVVAVRRLQYGTENCAHIAGYYSMGVHKGYQGRGYAKKFYEEFTKIAKGKGIKRVELTQSGGNEAAYHIADKLGFQTEVHLNEWLYRKTEGKEGCYHLDERYIFLLLDPTIKDKIVNNDMSFSPKLPALTQTMSYHIEGQGNNYICYDNNGKKVGVCTIDPGSSVLNHIVFATVSLEGNADQKIMADCLREISMGLQQQGFKKIEFFTHERPVITVLQQLGHHYRGEKVASLKIGDSYYNEAATDISFFNIEDAKNLLVAVEVDVYKRAQLSTKLSQCRATITSCVWQGTCDEYMGIYCENLAFQMLRDSLGEYPHYTKENAPWQSLIAGLPAAVKASFIDYAAALGIEYLAEASKVNQNQADHRSLRG